MNRGHTIEKDIERNGAMTNVKNSNDELKNYFNEIIDSISEDLLISDGKGVVVRVSPSFEEFYGIEEKKAIGRTVYELEEEGVFKPSVIARVISRKEKITMTQKDRRNRDILVTATPVFDEAGKLKFVVSFSRDITEMNRLQKRYSGLERKVEKYTVELNRLRREAIPEKNVIWKSTAMEKVMDTIRRVADVDANVLLLGESGVGKTMLAKELHQRSSRSEGPFIDINCAAIPENLLESELFGYEKGAFTGADSRGKTGLMKLADGGTLLLDEISELPLTLQGKLLKAIQEKFVIRVGGTTPIDVDFRLISASNRPLDQYAEEGKFRKDLYYRVNVVNIRVPSLAERENDIIPLISHFTDMFAEKYGMDKQFSPKAKECLVRYSWPGNVRELSNVIERALVTCDGETIQPEDLPEEITTYDAFTASEAAIPEEGLNVLLERVEGAVIRRAYKKYGTTVSVAKHLKISQPTAYRKVRKYIENQSNA